MVYEAIEQAEEKAEEETKQTIIHKWFAILLDGILNEHNSVCGRHALSKWTQLSFTAPPTGGSSRRGLNTLPRYTPLWAMRLRPPWLLSRPPPARAPSCPWCRTPQSAASCTTTSRSSPRSSGSAPCTSCRPPLPRGLSLPALGLGTPPPPPARSTGHTPPSGCSSPALTRSIAPRAAVLSPWPSAPSSWWWCSSPTDPSLSLSPPPTGRRRRSPTSAWPVPLQAPPHATRSHHGTTPCRNLSLLSGRQADRHKHVVIGWCPSTIHLS